MTDSRPRALALAVIAAHAALLWAFFAPAVCTPDANSYFSQARSLATRGVTYVVKESPAQYVGPHYSSGPDGRFYCAHGPGLAVLLAVPYRLLGPRSMFFVNPLLATLCLLGLMLLSARWLGCRRAWIPVAVMALNPFFNEHAHFGDAHIAVACALVWSLHLLAGLRARPSIAAAFAAGALAGFVPAARYAEAVYIPGLALFAAARRRRDGRDRPALAAAAAGTLAALVPLAVRNVHAYGAFWRTGYGASNGPALFSLRFLVEHAVPYLIKLPVEGAGLAALLAPPALLLMAPRARTRAFAAAVAAICIPSTLVYMAYFTPPDPQSMRYLLPLFPLLAVCASWLARGRRVLIAGLLLAQAVWGAPRSLLTMALLRMQDHALVQATRQLEERLPPGEIIIAPEILSQYLDVVGGWRLADGSLAGEGLTLLPPLPPPPGVAQPPRGFSPLDFIRLGYMSSRPDPYAGLDERRRFAAFARDVWSWDGGRRGVHWLLPPRSLARLRALLPRAERLEVEGPLDLGPEGLLLVEWRRGPQVRYSVGRDTAAAAR